VQQARVQWEYKTLHAVVKPRIGEAWSREGIPRYSFYRREWLAGLIARALETDVVPPTTIRQTERGIASVQEFIDGKTPMELPGDQWRSAATADSIEDIAALDQLLFSSDRHFGNLIIDGEGRAKAIDNGLSLTSDEKSNRIISLPLSEVSERIISPSLLIRLNRFYESDALREIVQEGILMQQENRTTQNEFSTA
jgi:hypothetical protein